MAQESEDLIVSGDLISHLIEGRKMHSAFMLSRLARRLEIVGFNLDPDGITQSVLSLDKYDDSFPIPTSHRTHHQHQMHSNFAQFLQQFITIERSLSRSLDKRFPDEF